jgi:hypothetical protein
VVERAALWNSAGGGTRIPGKYGYIGEQTSGANRTSYQGPGAEVPGRYRESITKVFARELPSRRGAAAGQQARSLCH